MPDLKKETFLLLLLFSIAFHNINPVTELSDYAFIEYHKFRTRSKCWTSFFARATCFCLFARHIRNSRVEVAMDTWNAYRTIP